MLSRLTFAQSHSRVGLHAVTKIDGLSWVTLVIRLARIIRRYRNVTETCGLPLKEGRILNGPPTHEYGLLILSLSLGT